MLCHSCWFLLSAHALKETKWISSVRYFINFPQKYKMYILEQKNKRRKKRQCTKNLHRRKHSPEEVSAGSAVFFLWCAVYSPFASHTHHSQSILHPSPCFLPQCDPPPLPHRLGSPCRTSSWVCQMHVWHLEVFRWWRIRGWVGFALDPSRLSVKLMTVAVSSRI